MIIMTVGIHALALDIILRKTRRLEIRLKQVFPRAWKTSLVSLVVLAVFMAHIFEIWLWAILFIALGEPHLQHLEAALYFSTSTFTTVGYGDLVLSEKWRLLASFESACGFILFGLSAAFIFEVISPLYKGQSREIEIKKNQKKSD